MRQVSPLFDADIVLSQSGGIEKLACELIRVACVDLRKRQAELLEGLSLGNCEVAREAAHSLRGLAGLGGMSQLLDEVSEWESALAEGIMPESLEVQEQLSNLIDKSIEAAWNFTNGNPNFSE